MGFGRAKRVPCRGFAGEFTNGQTNCHQGCFGNTTRIRLDPQNPSQYVLDMHHGITINTGLALSVGLCIPATLSLVSIWLKLVREQLDHLAISLPTWKNGGFWRESKMRAASSDEIQQREGFSHDEQTRREEKEDGCNYPNWVRIGRAHRIHGAHHHHRYPWGEESLESGDEGWGRANVVRRSVRCSASSSHLLYAHLLFTGQWAPILGAVMTALGSWFTSSRPTTPLLPLHHHHGHTDCADRDTSAPWHDNHDMQPIGQTSDVDNDRLAPPTTVRVPVSAHDLGPAVNPDSSPGIESHRTVVSRYIHGIAVWLTPTPERFVDDIALTPDKRDYRRYPHTPGEEQKNPNLRIEDEIYDKNVQEYERASTPDPDHDDSQPESSKHPAGNSASSQQDNSFSLKFGTCVLQHLSSTITEFRIFWGALCSAMGMPGGRLF